RTVAPWLALFIEGAVHAEDRRERAELDPARVILVGRMAVEAAAVHAPFRFADFDRTQHARALRGHAREAGVDVARPHAVRVALRAQPEGAVDRPHALVAHRALRVVQRPLHVEELR